MGIKRIGYGDKYKALGYSEYICDTESDLDLLPTNKSSKVVDGSVLPKCSAGSRAIVVESKKVYVLNTDGVWSEFIDHSGAGGGSGAVTSVNGKTGAVVLDASDVGALPDDTVIPAAVTVDSALSPTSENPVQNKVVKAALDGKGTYSKPSGGIPASDLAQAVQDKLDESGLPGVTESDIGKVLAVDSNGEWAAENPVIVSGTDAQVTDAVNDWLGENPIGIVGTLQADGTLYVEDMSLVADFDSEVF